MGCVRGRLAIAAGVLIGAVSLLAIAAHAQMSHMAPAGRQESAPPPIRATMSELHAHGGVPKGWNFLLPPGDAAEGRKVFVAMECFACHMVKGETFPQTSETQRDNGPELTGMGSHHPAEYFAESIINPNRVIVQGPGYTGPDSLSKMPSYADSMTLEQLIDVVAYLKSLTGGEMGDMAQGHHDIGSSMKMGDSMKMK
jgi:mono/diheme cytochrome c family protein